MQSAPTLYRVSGLVYDDFVLAHAHVKPELDPLLGGFAGLEYSEVGVEHLLLGDTVYRKTRYEGWQPFTFTGIEVRGHNQVITHEPECQVGKDWDAIETAIYPPIPDWVMDHWLGLD